MAQVRQVCFERMYRALLSFDGSDPPNDCPPDADPLQSHVLGAGCYDIVVVTPLRGQDL